MQREMESGKPEKSKDTEPIDLKKKRAEKREKENADKDSKPKKAEFYKAIAYAIDRDKYSFIGDFPEKFYAVELDPGIRIVVKENIEHGLEIVGLNTLVQSIVNYCHNILVPSGKECYSFTAREAKECADFWLAFTKPIPQPKMVSWADDTSFTYRRLPWKEDLGDTPTFDEMMGRATNKDALMAFIGSLFINESDKQQYIWIHGRGKNGKSALTLFLKRALNGAYKALITPSGDSRFWTLNLIGARLGVFADTNNTTFITGGLFKSLTGGDPVPCEIKSGAQFTKEMNCKFIFLSNSRPEINSENADMRRLILCEMSEIKCAPDPNYQDRLWSEGGYFLTKCLRKYAELCPDHAQIPISNLDEVKDWVSTVEEDFEAFFTHNIEIDPHSSIVPCELNGRIRDYFKNQSKEREFRAWLERTHNVMKKSKKVDGVPIKIYPGVRLVNVLS